ncbi:hypothetical protein DER46DRAFT_638511 [Fusarium sp. MPI-SDFR-AT-0072]|nr:hypothetical protein DER46DRAFT_638511 [Fusarium sp. MPI-SDFR-AT-0072]
MSSNANAKIYLLNSPNDWDSFEQSYIMKTTAERVYKLARLSDPRLFSTLRIREPQRPEIGDYPARPSSELPLGSSSTKRTKRRATQYSDLLATDQEVYKAEINIYHTNFDQYNKQADSIRNILNWIIEKISPHYIKTYSPAANESSKYNNISQFFLNLKAACGINEAIRRKQAQKHYFEVLKSASSPRTNWEEKLRGITKAQHPNTWFKDLQQALDQHFKIFLRIKQSRNKEEIENRSYLPLNFSAQFRQEIQDSKQKSEKIQTNQVAKGSFRPAFRASNQECMLCEKSHKYPNSTSCWVAFPDTAPKRIQPNQRQLDLFKQRLEGNKEIRELYKKLQIKHNALKEKSS